VVVYLILGQEAVYALGGLLAPTLAVVVTYLLTRKKIQEIHIIVNSKMTEALNRIVSLEHKLNIKAGEDPDNTNLTL